MPATRLSIVVTDGRRFLVDLTDGRDLPGLDVTAGDAREDEEILAEHGPRLTRMQVSGFAFLDSVFVHRGAGRIVNLYLATELAGESLPAEPPEGLAWATTADLDRSLIPDEVLTRLDALLRESAAASSEALRSAWGAYEAGG